MRIVSDFYDYYDDMQDRSKDRLNRVYVRTKTFVPLTKSQCNFFEEHTKSLLHFDKDLWIRGVGSRTIIYSGYLLIAGKLYPYIEDRRSETPVFCWTVEQARTRGLDEFENKERYWGYGLKRASSLEEFFNQKLPDVSSLSIELKILVAKWKLTRSSEDKHVLGIIKDYKLKDFEFNKLMDKYSIYQELDIFISNVLVDDTTDADESNRNMTDEDRLKAAGFDKKVSFRHPVKFKKGE